jgi:hypothetical protein
MIMTDNLTLAIRLTSDEGFLVLQTVLVNNSEKLIEFDSDRWEAAHYASLPDSTKANADLKTERSIPSRDLIRDIRTETADSLLLEKFMTESLIERRTDSSPIVENPRNQKMTPVPTSNRGARPVQEPNKADQERAQNMGISSVALSQAKQKEIRKYALIAKSIPPKGSLKGLVYFKRVKKAEIAEFRLPIGDATFSFVIPYVNK